MTPKQMASALAAEIAGKKGTDIQILDLRGVSSFTDFFVIATGSSSRHVRTLADATVRTARQLGEPKPAVEGDPPGRWILVDLGEVVMHLFVQEARDFYALERLWDEAERVETPPAAPVAKAAP